MLYLRQDNEIRASITQFSLCKTLWLDTEVADWWTKNPRLSLIQVLANPDDLTGDGVYILDVLDQSELVKDFIDQIMVNPKIEKVFHKSSYDLQYLGGNQAQKVICTLKMANKISLDSLGTPNRKLKTLARELCGFSDVSEEEGTSDWGRRPLTTRQLHYAKMDVVYLAQVHLYLRAKANGQLSLPPKDGISDSNSQEFSSTSLQDKCKQLIEISQKKIELQKYATNLQGFQSRQEQIAKAVAGTLPLVQALRAFRQRGIADVNLTQKTDALLADALLAIITEAEAKFQENPEWIIENKNFGKASFYSKVEQLQNALREQLSQAWRSYRTKKTPRTNNEILNLLEQVSNFKLTVQRIRSLDLQIQQLNSFPQSSDDFERVDGLIEQLKQCWDSLNADEVPEAALRFLKVAANQGAPLSLLTPEVKDWLTKHGLIDSLRIRLA